MIKGMYQSSKEVKELWRIVKRKMTLRSAMSLRNLEILRPTSTYKSLAKIQ